MKTIFYLSISILLLFTSCMDKANTVMYTIASQNADCTGVGRQKCLLVKKGDAKDWEYFYSHIEGFNYEPGYEYQLEVKEEKLEDVPADASSVKYVLVKEISKINKISENLPPAIEPEQIVYQCTGKVLAIESENIGRGAAEGKFKATVVQIEVTSSIIDGVKEGDIIYCELVPSPTVIPVVGNEYVFKSKNLHPAHAKGTYLLETDVMDFV